MIFLNDKNAAAAESSAPSAALCIGIKCPGAVAQTSDQMKPLAGAELCPIYRHTRRELAPPTNSLPNADGSRVSRISQNNDFSRRCQTKEPL